MKTWAKVLMVCWLVALWMQLGAVNATTTSSVSPSSAPEAVNSTSAPGANSTLAPGVTNSTSAPGVTNSTSASGVTNSTVAPTATNSTSAPGATNSTSAPTATNSTSAPGVTNSTSAPGVTNSTLAPTATNSTSAPSATNSTSAPSATNSTSAPGVTNSTLAPGVTNSTSAPGVTNSTLAPGVTNSTSAPGVTNSTLAPGVTSPTPVNGSAAPSTAEASTTPPATTRPDPCALNPCPTESRCEQRFESFVCVCFPGLVLEANVCKKAKVFTGNLRINRTFTNGMSDTTSKEFKEISDEIVAELKIALSGTNGYLTSTVHRLRNGSVIADVENIYSLTSNTTADVVTEALTKAANCANCLFAGATLTATDICDESPCDSISTDCSSNNGDWNCQCKTGYVKHEFTIRSCTLCPPGTKAENNKCIDCSFGYSGINCNESYLLAVVVVACVLGGLLLIFLIVLIVVCCRKSKKGSAVVKSPYIDMDFTKRSQVPKIPRATASKGWEPANLELVESGSTRALVTPDRQGNGMRNTPATAYRTHGQVNPYYQHNEGH